MSESNEIIKFVPCSIDNVCDIEEWLDALSKEGYLLKSQTINLLAGIFYLEPDKRRYYHHVVAGEKTKKKDIFENDRITIEKYTEKGMEFLGKTCGYYFFRTDQLSVIERVCAPTEKKRKLNLIFHGIMTIIMICVFSAVLFHGLSIYNYNMFANILAEVMGLLLVVIVLVLGVEVYGAFEDLKIPEKMKPTYQRKLKLQTPELELTYKAMLLILILSFVVLILMQDLMLGVVYK